MLLAYGFAYRWSRKETTFTDTIGIVRDISYGHQFMALGKKRPFVMAMDQQKLLRRLLAGNENVTKGTVAILRETIT